MNEPPRDYESDSVLARVQPGGYDSSATTEYEVCRELLGQVVAFYSGELADQERSTSPDSARIAELRESRAHYARLMRDLDVKDRDQVARVRQECVQVLHERAHDS